MADGVEFKLEGLEELRGKLKALEGIAQDKTARFALRKAASLVRDNAKAKAARFDDPTTDENIAESIVVRADTKFTRMTGDLKMRVGVRGGSGKGALFYWRFLEFGTQHMAAQPFMRPAMDESIGPATNEFLSQFEKAIDRAVRRANRAKTR